MIISNKKSFRGRSVDEHSTCGTLLTIKTMLNTSLMLSSVCAKNYTKLQILTLYTVTLLALLSCGAFGMNEDPTTYKAFDEVEIKTHYTKELQKRELKDNIWSRYYCHRTICEQEISKKD